MECPLSKVTVLFKTNTVEMADIYCTCHHDMKQKIINIFKCIKELNAQKQGGDGKRGGVSIHEEMHKFKWVSVKRVVGVGVCLFFERMLFQG